MIFLSYLKIHEIVGDHSGYGEAELHRVEIFIDRSNKLVFRSEIRCYFDQRWEMRHLREQIRAQIHDFLKEELALLVDL